MAKRQTRDWDKLVPEILNDLNKGKRLTTIAKNLGLSTERIRQVMKERGETIPAQRPLPLGKRPSKQFLLQREHDIIHDRTVEGLSLEDIGRKYQITRERVRQILVASGHEHHTDQAREGKAEREAARKADIQHQLVALLTKNPELSRADLAAKVKIAPEEVTKMLGTSVWMLSEDQASTVAYSSKEMIAHIRRAAKEKKIDEISGRIYDDWRRETKSDTAPGSQAIIRRFGSWSNAVKEAGLEPIAPRRTNYQRITWEEATNSVAAFIVQARQKDPYTHATSAEYEVYSQSQTEERAPSIAGIRLYWSWREVRIGAVRKILKKISEKNPGPKKS